jgi:Spy/CpxP family protein refolding chaperone
MLRTLISITAGVLVAFVVVIGPAQAKPLALPWFQDVDLTASQQELMEQLESQYVPKIEAILFPNQRENFEKAIQEGYSLRKAFKSMALTLEQKSQLAATMKAIPKQELFAALTPEQKKEVFMKKKELFTPTPEEIMEKIQTGMKAKEKFAPDVPGAEMAPTAEEISKKIQMGLDKKKEFMPSLEEIQEKISEKIESLTE